MKKLSQNDDPPSCICEILIQIFYREFRDKIKIRQNIFFDDFPECLPQTNLFLIFSLLFFQHFSNLSRRKKASFAELQKFVPFTAHMIYAFLRKGIFTM